MTTASKITLVRVFMIPLVMIAMYLSKGVSGLWMWVSLGLFVIASVTDFIDGQIARKCNQVSDFGKFLDPLADKLLTIAVMTMFCEWGRFPAWALMLVLTREFAVTGLRLVAAPKGRVIAGRLERQGENRQHHDWSDPVDAAARKHHGGACRLRRHRGDHGVLRHRVFYQELELPVELMFPRH